MAQRIKRQCHYQLRLVNNKHLKVKFHDTIFPSYSLQLWHAHLIHVPIPLTFQSKVNLYMWINRLQIYNICVNIFEIDVSLQNSFKWWKSKVSLFNYPPKKLKKICVIGSKSISWKRWWISSKKGLTIV